MIQYPWLAQRLSTHRFLSKKANRNVDALRESGKRIVARRVSDWIVGVRNQGKSVKEIESRRCQRLVNGSELDEAQYQLRVVEHSFQVSELNAMFRAARRAAPLH